MKVSIKSNPVKCKYHCGIHYGHDHDNVMTIIRTKESKKKDTECKTSCKESIKELLGEYRKPKKNTIPFNRYFGDCEPFKVRSKDVLSHIKGEPVYLSSPLLIFSYPPKISSISSKSFISKSVDAILLVSK